MSDKASLHSIIIIPQNKMEKMSHKHALALSERDSTENNLQNALAIERETVANLQNEVAQLKVGEYICVCGGGGGMWVRVFMYVCVCVCVCVLCSCVCVFVWVC